MQEIKSLREILWEQFSKKDCIAFDLDETCFVQKDKIMRNFNSKERTEFLNELRALKGNERVTFAYDNSEYQLLEPDFLEILSQIQSPIMGFTARRSGKATMEMKTTVEDDTIETLRKLGIDFQSAVFPDLQVPGMNQLNPEFEREVMDPKLRPFQVPGDVMIKSGVLFTNNLNKGLVLSKVFSLVDFVPETFVLIDDKISNLQSVDQTISEINLRLGTNIKFVGYHYTQYLEIDNQLDSNVVSQQKEALLEDPPRYLPDSHFV